MVRFLQDVVFYMASGVWGMICEGVSSTFMDGVTVYAVDSVSRNFKEWFLNDINTRYYKL